MEFASYQARLACDIIREPGTHNSRESYSKHA